MNKKLLAFISIILMSGISGFAVANSGGLAQKGMFLFSPYSHSSNLADENAGTTEPSADDSISVSDESTDDESTGMGKNTKIALGVGAGLLAAGGIAAIIAMGGGSSDNNPPAPPGSPISIMNSQSSGPLYSYTSSTTATADANGQFSSGKVTVENTSGATMNGLGATISKPPAAGTLTLTGDTCGASLATGESCYFSYHYAAPTAPVSDGNFIVYPAIIRISYSGGSIDYNTDLYHINKGHFINIPTNAPNYKKLASNHVNGVFVDSKGYMYAATDGGLSVSTDNGKTFVNKTTTDGLGSNHVNSVFVDSSGRIYVATEGGLSISSDGGATFKTKGTDEHLGSDIVKGVYVTSNGYIYASTYKTGTAAGGLSISTNGGVSFNNHPAGNDEVNGAYVDTTGKIYAATNGGLAVSFDGGNTFTTHALPNNGVNGAYADAAGKIYIATKGGLFAGNCTAQTQCTFNVVLGLAGNPSIWNVFVDSKGYIYAATEMGGLAISKNEGTSFTAKTTFDGLGDNSVRDVHVDTGGKIYAATHGGLSISDNSGIQFSNQTTSASLGDSFVRGVYVDPTGKIYAATEDGLSISSDGGSSFTNKTTADGLGNNTVENVTVAVASGKIYAATWSGLSISSDGGTSFTNFDSSIIGGLANDYVGDVYVDGNNTIYAGTGGGLSIGTCSSGTTCSFTTHLTGLTSNLVKGAYKYGNFLYLATETDTSSGLIKDGGLSISTDEGATFINKTTTEGLADNSVHSVFVSANGTLYAATHGGLSVSWDNGNTFYNEPFDNEEASKHVYGVYAVSDISNATVENVYAATEKGIWVGTCNSGSRSCMFNLTSKTTDNGLGDYYVEGVFVDASGKIYAATYGGLSVAQP